MRVGSRAVSTTNAAPGQAAPPDGALDPAAFAPPDGAMPRGWTPLVDATSPAVAGGKGAALGRLAAAGLPVPSGVALAPDLVTGVAAGTALHRDGLARALESLGAGAPAWLAVRSSAVDEDGGGASFAGQHATVLGVPSTLDAVADAVARVWRSAREPSALAYRARMGLTPEPRMAVVVQHLVDAEVAGVAFSRHPVTGADEIVVEGSWGLGEAVVAGLVTPDHARLTRAGALLERRPGPKDVALRLEKGRAGGVDGAAVVERPVAPHLALAVALTDDVLAAVVDLVHRCERALGGPQDVEWAFAGGALHCLQSRPITRAGGAAPRR